jgi:hypothetical protein
MMMMMMPVLYKAEAVPLHATKALGERENISASHSRPRH